MADALTLALKITADAAGLKTALTEAQADVAGFGQRVSAAGAGAGQALNAVGEAGQNARRAVAAVGQAAAGTGDGIAAGTAAATGLGAALSQVTADAGQHGRALAQVGQAAEISAGQVAMGRRIVTSNLINVANVAVATRGDLVMMLSPVPDILYGLKEMGIGFSGAALGVAGAAAVIAGFGGALVAGAMRASDMSGQLRELQQGLRGVGREGELSAQRMRQDAYDLAAGPGDVGRGDAVGAMKGLAGSRMVDAGNMKASAEVARDLAAAMGRELPEAVNILTQTFDGGEAAIRKLNDTMRFASSADLEHIHGLYQHGRAADAVRETITLLRRQIGGLADDEMGRLAKAWRDGKNAASEFADAASRVFRDASPAEALQAAERDLKHARKAAADPTAGIDVGMFEHRARALRRDPADAAAANADMMTVPAATQFSSQRYEVLAHERRDRARILAIANPVERRQAEAEFQARRDAAAQGVEGGYLDLVGKEAGKGALDDIGAGATQAADRMRVMAEAQRLVAAAAGQGAKAEADAARQAALLVFAYDNGTASLGAYGAALKSIDQSRLSGAQATATSRMQREGKIADDLTAAYASGRVELIRSAEAEREGVDLHLQTGMAMDKARVAIEQLNIKRASPEIAKHLRDLATEADTAERLAAAQRAGDRGAVRAVTVDADARKFALDNPNAGAAQVAEFRRGRERQYSNQVAAEADQTNLAYDAAARYDAELAKLDEQRATGLVSVEAYARRYRELEDDKLAASREWADGATRGVRAYVREATDAAASAERAMTGSLKASEDAFVRWAMTGEMSAKTMFNSIAEEAVRAAYRMAVVRPLFGGADGGGGLFGALMKSVVPAIVTGGTAMQYGTDFGSTQTQMLATQDAGLYHVGGIAGRGTGQSRTIDAGLVARAPRYHGGGVAGDEEVAVLRHGEGIFTPRQMANADRLVAAAMARPPASAPVEINVHNYGEGKARAEQRQRPDGGMGIDVIVEDIENRIARNVSRGEGPLVASVEGRYGIQPRGSY